MQQTKDMIDGGIYVEVELYTYMVLGLTGYPIKLCFTPLFSPEQCSHPTSLHSCVFPAEPYLWFWNEHIHTGPDREMFYSLCERYYKYNYFISKKMFNGEISFPLKHCRLNTTGESLPPDSSPSFKSVNVCVFSLLLACKQNKQRRGQILATLRVFPIDAWIRRIRCNPGSSANVSLLLSPSRLNRLTVLCILFSFQIFLC